MAEDSPQAVSNSQARSYSTYHNQAEVISNFSNYPDESNILSANRTLPNPEEQDVFVPLPSNSSSSLEIKTATKDNNTTPNDIQVFPVPAAVSSVLDILPVHPRIPRKSGGRRRNRPRQHRHSTRVIPRKPVRYLLPPFENQLILEYTSSTTSTTAASFSLDPIIVTFPPSLSPPTSTEPVPIKEHEEAPEKEIVPQNVSTPQYRKVFIPPPLRYLLPPFFYENYINAQPSTTITPMAPDKNFLFNDYYDGNFSFLNNAESSSIAPIIVFETTSEGDYEFWSQHSNLNPDSSHSQLQKEEVNIPRISNSEQFTTEATEIRASPLDRISQYGQYREKTYEEHSSDEKPHSELIKYQNNYLSTTTQQNDESINANHYNSSVLNSYSLQPTTTPALSSPTSSLPTLSGPNIEQTLFETGDFFTVDEPLNESDPTVSMMNKPLLSKEVAQAGMKITPDIKDNFVKKEKFMRGRLKFNHLNQFNFELSDKSVSRSKSSQLEVAESSYYGDNRRLTQVVQQSDIKAIPGRPGQDYPTFTKPPPESRFSCQSVDYHRGYVADPSTGCQVFYICVGNGPGEAMLCPNGTVFSQDFLVCDWWYNVDCQTQT